MLTVSSTSTLPVALDHHAPVMPRALVNIGLALVDARVRPDSARWIMDLLRSAGRTDLPLPVVETYRGRTAVLFGHRGRDLTLVVERPGHARWCRIHPDRTMDQDDLCVGFGPGVQDLLDWLMHDEAVKD